jgi:hypothetical protein
MVKILGYQAWARFYQGGKKSYISPKGKLFTKSQAQAEGRAIDKKYGIIKLGGAYGYREVYANLKDKEKRRNQLRAKLKRRK